MPYCHKCGKKIDEDAKFCDSCGASQTTISPEREQTIASRRYRHAYESPSRRPSIAGPVALIVIVVGFLIFAGTIEVFDCPNCNNSPLLRWACSYCGGDGKVTLFQRFSYSLSIPVQTYLMINISPRAFI